MIILGGTCVSAQDFESFKRQQQERFLAYKQKTQEDFDAYRRKVNEDFAEYMKKPWEKKTGEAPVPEPEKEPDIPPVILPDIDIELPDDNLVEVEVVPLQIDDTPIPIAPLIYKPKPAEKTVDFLFYGTHGIVRFDPAKKVQLNGVDENAVSDFWKGLSGEAYDNILADCQKIREDRDLCDWAYYKMLEKVAEALYSSRNERVIFHSWLLTQSGFAVKLGRELDILHMILACSNVLFGKVYWTEDGIRYYLMDDDEVTALNLMDYSFPNCTPLRMSMGSKNLFDTREAPGRSLASDGYPELDVNVICDQNVIDFLGDIPVSGFSGTNIANYLMYADVPLSESARGELYSDISNRIAGKTQAEAANVILDFVQTAFDYKVDADVWGYERPLFPEETLFYPYSDCEDRAILFSRLVRDLMGLEVALVLYPGHLATAVLFTQDVSGDYFRVDGNKYIVCDPTYIHAPIGLTMPGMDNATARVFLVK